MSVPELLLESLKKHGGRIAVSAGDSKTTYTELLLAAGGIAADLRSRGIQNQTIGLFSEKCPATYAALLGIWFSGNHFVPLPKAAPTGWIQALLESANPALLLGTFDPQQEPSLAGSNLPFFRMPATAPEVIRAFPAPRAEITRVEPSDLAYLMFTSGSSGKPKGCAITHGNLRAYVAHAMRAYDFHEGDRISQAFELTFDPSLSDILWAFLNGAALCPLPAIELSWLDQYLSREKITVWSSSPSMASLALATGSLRGKTFPHLRLSTFIGETLTSELVNEWAALFPGAEIENIYGPVEATISVSRYRLPPRPVQGPIPIGGPNPGTEFLLLNEELWIGGDQVCRGYLNPEWNASRFVERTFEGLQARWWYRTGDSCERLPSGDWCFSRRLDQQIKIFGQRAEPEGVENLAEQAGFPGCVALPWPVREDGKYESLALVMPAKKSVEEVESLLAFLRSRLPGFSVPKFVFHFPRYPLTQNGKLDRNALLAQASASQSSEARIYPR